jgi:aryl-alcohol dehydrogenase-like predicted oxidoreductase
VVLASKFFGNLFPGDPNGGGAGRKAVMQQVDASLRRLGTDYIDLYWQHNFDRHTPLAETMSALNDLVQAGKVRYLGLSDTPAWAVARAGTIAEFRGWAGVAAIQVEYSLLQRTVEGELFGAARELGLGVTPWSPLASGVLSGKYSRDNQSPARSGRERWAAAHLTEATFALLDVLQRMSGELGTSVAALALAWVRSQPEVTSTIIGCRTLKQLNDNLDSLDVTMTDEQQAELSQLTEPELNFPAAFLSATAIPWQQAGTTINGVASAAYSRS